jgi:hypothetical protein
MTRELGVTPPGHGQLPIAPVLNSDHAFALVMVIALYAGFAGTLAWALWKLVRAGEKLPLILTVAGVLAANAEPIGDTVGLIVYAPDIPWFDYHLMGREMPSFILVGLAGYVAFASYYACRMLQEGRSLRYIAFVSAVVVGIPEVLMELGWHHWHVIAYYGDNPTRVFGIPLYTIIQNTTLLPVYGVVTFIAVEQRKQWWLVLALPFTTIGYIVGITWPVYQAIQSSAAAPVTWACTLVVIVGCLGATYAALNFPSIRARREAATRATQEPVAA